MSKIFVMIPTYNEAGNIRKLIHALFEQPLPSHELHVLVVDDNSPDGTSGIVSEMARADSKVHLTTRIGKRGRGSAGIDGFKETLRLGADYIIEMDADFSHDPRAIPSLVAACEKGSDVVLGSRFVKGGSDDDRGLLRQWITKFAGVYVRTMLNLKVKDVSSGYRCFKRSALESVGLDSLISTGPSIVLEILYRCSQKGFVISEVPIVFIDRTVGTTKLDSKTLLKTLLMVLKFRESR